MPYNHFTRKEQYVISHMVIADFSLREIGRKLGRHHTSINREITRNRPTYADDAVYWESGTIRGLDFHAVAIIDTRFSMFMPGNHRQKVSRKSSFRTSTRVCTVADPPHLPFLRKTFADQ